jgi:hypothetical protein
MRFLLTLMLALASASALAQVYRWVDAKGTVHYSNEKPPDTARATVVPFIDARPGPPSPDSQDCYSVRCQGERMEERIARRDEAEAKATAARVAAAPRPPNGLEFRKYISIQRGMTEGEMLVIAGTPDLVARDGWAIRTYTFFPTVSDPFTTSISVVNGRVSGLERNRKF